MGWPTIPTSNSMKIQHMLDIQLIVITVIMVMMMHADYDCNDGDDDYHFCIFASSTQTPASKA